RKKDLPSQICAVVDGYLRRDRDERCATAGAVATQIEAALAEIRAARYGDPNGPPQPGAMGGAYSLSDPSEPTQVTRRHVPAGGYPMLGAADSGMSVGGLPAKGAVALATGVGVVVGLVMMALMMTLLK